MILNVSRFTCLPSSAFSKSILRTGYTRKVEIRGQCPGISAASDSIKSLVFSPPRSTVNVYRYRAQKKAGKKDVQLSEILVRFVRTKTELMHASSTS